MLSAVSALHEATGMQPLDLTQPTEAVTTAVMCGALVQDKAEVAVAVIAELVGMLEAGLTAAEGQPLLEDVGTELAALLLAVYRTAHLFSVDIDAVVAGLETSMLRAFPE